MNGEIEKLSAATGVPAEKLQEHFQAQSANAMASVEPLPGPTRRAFDPCQDIKCGKYTVRPCYDADIEYLSLLNHPLHRMRLQAQASKAVDEQYEGRGAGAWELCYLFTRSLDDVDRLWAEGGLPGFRAAAAAEFRRYQRGDLVVLSEACLKQYFAYWEPVLSYGAPSDDETEGPKLKKAEPPPTGSGS